MPTRRLDGFAALHDHPDGHGLLLRGWALDRDDPGRPLRLAVCLHASPVAVLDTALARLPGETPAHPAAFAWSVPPGLGEQLPAGAPDGLSLRLPDGSVLAVADGRDPYAAAPRLLARGQVDGPGEGGVRGWAVALDPSGAGAQSPAIVSVSCDGAPCDLLVADRARADVAHALGCDERCGFCWHPPAGLRDDREHEFGFSVVLPGREEAVALSQSPVRLAFASVGLRTRLSALRAESDALLDRAWSLRRALGELESAEELGLDDYDRWAQRYLPALRRRLAGAAARRRSPPPLVSVVCPVFRPRLSELLAAIASVRMQTHARWELLLVDDASASPALDAVLDEAVRDDGRIRVLRLPARGGIAAASNAAIAAARGEWVAFLDQDDLLADAALDAMLDAALGTDALLLYSDEDKLDEAGRLCEPHLKGGWNRRLLLSCNYVCHLVMVRADALREAGSLRPGFEGAQDHDLLLRLSERIEPARIRHVPEILYHWRRSAGSTAASAAAKPQAGAAGLRAVQDHLDRRRLPGRARPVLAGATFYAVDWGFERQPSVSIIVPFRDQAAITGRCLQALHERTDYQAHRIVLVDDGSTEPEAAALAARAAALPRTEVLRLDEPFNWSRLNNLAARAAPAEFFLFLNNDVVVSEPSWLRRMVGEAQADPGVGIVGAGLHYPGGALQHAGVVLGVGGIADHPFRFLPQGDGGYMARALCAGEWSAVTGACMLVRAHLFATLGGFDETLAVAFNDVDFCLRAQALGARVVCVPDARAEHAEQVSRGDDWREERRRAFVAENALMLARWQAVLPRDPFYSRFFSRHGGIFRQLSDAAAEAPP